MTTWPLWRADLFDPRKVPFSRRGSFIAISWLDADGAFWLRNLRGGDEQTDLGRLVEITVLDASGAPVTPDWVLTPDCLTARVNDLQVQLCFDGPNRICIAGTGLGIRLEAGASKYNYAQAATDHVHLCIARQDLRCNIAADIGTVQLWAEWNGLSSDSIKIDVRPTAGNLVATLDMFRIEPEKRVAIDQAAARAEVASEFNGFLATMPQVAETYAEGRLLAAYILWSAEVPAEGALTRPAIYMSKNWMTNIWSWDHCFVALALAEGQPEHAFAQMEVMFNAQADNGRLPDFINDRYAYWAFTKPPVHGWTFARLRAAAPQNYGPERVSKMVKWLQTQTDNWLAGPRLGTLPAYRHGNDAGWDNATVFAEGGPLVSPDLATLLILQLDEIAALHRLLGQEAEALVAIERADRLCVALCADLWDGDGFVARLQTNGKIVECRQSLLLFLPLLLGERLPHGHRFLLLKKLTEAHHFTDHGLATEATDSPLYRADGYWRGPIWAPTTMLFFDALLRCGADGLAKSVAERYCAMCCASGMAENHDAITGEALRDPAFAWTSAVFLCLGQYLSPAR